MLEIKEYLDIKKIEQIRKSALGRELDDHDNFAWHIALFENKEVVGVGRLYPYKDGLLADKPALLKDNKHFYEMLFRTLLLKAESCEFKYVYVNEIAEYYKPFGFKAFDGEMRVSVREINYPKLCGKCGGKNND